MSDVREKINLGSRPPGVPSAERVTVPAETVPLPSKGLVYPVESALHNVTHVDIRAMTAREEDILTSRALIKKGTAMSALIQSCLLDKSVDPDEMLVGDRNAVLIALRVTGYGAAYEVQVSCPACESQFDHVFDLSRLPMKTLDTPPMQVGVNLFSFTLPISKREVTFSLMTGAKEREMSLVNERKKKAGDMQESAVTSRLFNQIVSIAGENDRGKLSRLVGDMLAGDSLALRREIDRLDPGVEMVDIIVCKSCGEESEVDVPIGTEFFWPQLSRR